tara:strand:- start:287 stop:841 length:555 start_codon:yes stop_codon:yes gene_type:complete
MDEKKLIRRSYFIKRKKFYFEIDKKFFDPLFYLVKKLKRNKKMSISIYYPNSFEINILKILENEKFRKFNFLLPKIGKKNSMNFYKWSKKDILYLNKYGIPEPLKSKKILPDIILVPLLVYDKNKNRIGYGKGFYDRYLNKFIRFHKKIITVGVAFSFQKYHNLPVNNKDFKLDYIITDKGMIK